MKGYRAGDLEHLEADGGRQRIAGGLDSLEPAALSIPLKWRFEGLERRERGLDDFGTDSISGNQCGGNGLRH